MARWFPSNRLTLPVVVVSAALGAAACGSTTPVATSGTPAPITTPTATVVATSAPTARPAPISAADVRLLTEPGDTGNSSTLHIADGNGKILATIDISDGANDVGVVGTGPDLVWVAAKSHVTIYGADGAKRGTYALNQDTAQLLFSPDGTEWVWSAPNGAHTSGVFMESTTSGIKQVATLPWNGFTTVEPVRWWGSTIYLTGRQTSGGGRIAFASGIGLYTLDATSHAIVQTLSSSCDFQDVSATGTVLCIDATSQQTVKIIDGTNVRTTTFGTPGQWQQTGDGQFAVDGRSFVVSGNSFDANDEGSKNATYSGLIASGTPHVVGTSLAASPTYLPAEHVGVLAEPFGASATLVSAAGLKTALTVPRGDMFDQLIGVVS